MSGSLRSLPSCPSWTGIQHPTKLPSPGPPTFTPWARRAQFSCDSYMTSLQAAAAIQLPSCMPDDPSGVATILPREPWLPFPGILLSLLRKHFRLSAPLLERNQRGSDNWAHPVWSCQALGSKETPTGHTDNCGPGEEGTPLAKVGGRSDLMQGKSCPVFSFFKKNKSLRFVHKVC